MKDLIYLCIILCLFILVFNRTCPQPSLPSVIDIQEQLVERGYEITVDGKCGPETQRAWDSAWDLENFSNEVFE
jgi:hypothetical protein